MNSVHSLVREAEVNYLQGTTKLGKYVNWSMHNTIETIDAYLNSKHTSGPVDSLGREKPFFNIVTAACNIWYRATKLDRKDIRLVPDKITNTAATFIANVHLHQWMKDAKFGQFLHQWGRSLARYGSSAIKFVEKEGQLYATVVPWNRIIADPVSWDAIPHIEKFYLTPAQLIRRATKGDPEYMGYDYDQAEALIRALQTRRTLDKYQQDNQSKFIELYEVHGMMDKRFMTDEMVTEEPAMEFRQQMHVLSYLARDKNDGFDDFTLYKGPEKKDPYLLTHLIEEDGRTLSIGAVEYLFDAQWMQNHSMKNMKDTLDLASRLIFQTADTHFVGRNVLTAIETGDVLIHEENKPLERIANDKPSIEAVQNFMMQWDQLSKELTATPDAIRGNNQPSDTPYSQTAFLGAQANSLFEIMTENKGLHIEEMMREFILPFLKKKFDTKDEIVATLESHDISQLDAMYLPRQAIKQYNDRAKEDILNGKVPQQFDMMSETQNVQSTLAPLGNKRSFAPDEIGEKTWKEVFKDLELTVEVDVTNENINQQALLQTLSTVLQTLASNPMLLQDPNAKLVFSKLLSQTGAVSPLELSTASAQAPQQPMQQAPQQTPTAVPTTAMPEKVVPSKTAAAPLIGG